MALIGSQVGRIVGFQCLIGIGCIAAFLLMDLVWPSTTEVGVLGEIRAGQGFSAALAMISSLLPNAYYAWVQQRTFNATRLLLHGVLRMLLTATLMALSIVVFGIKPAGFFVSFAIMQLAYFKR